jgi:hypothetical protein
VCATKPSKKPYSGPAARDDDVEGDPEPGGPAVKITRKSMVTGVTHTLDLPVTTDQLEHYLNGALLQDAFPDLAPPLREFIKNGITPEEYRTHVLGLPPEEDAP